jgi:hypothetical protein
MTAKGKDIALNPAVSRMTAIQAYITLERRDVFLAPGSIESARVPFKLDESIPPL